MTTLSTLNAEARRLAAVLQERKLQIVFAESCTGGLIAAVLARIPGISGNLCGSAVVYQIETKATWLGVSRDLLDDPGPVSRIVAEQMAVGVLEKTPQATISASVTGHLGPNAPPDQDGLIYVGVARRRMNTPQGSRRRKQIDVEVQKFWLDRERGQASEQKPPRSSRLQRQYIAAQTVLKTVLRALS